MRLKISPVCLLLTSIFLFAACSDNKKLEAKKTHHTQQSASDSTNDLSKVKPATSDATIHWDKVPTLTNIGDFPFLSFPEGLDVYDIADKDGKKDGITDLFPLQKLEVYTGTNVVSLEGKLATLIFVEDTSNGFKYDQYLFERSVPDYLQKIGAKLIYQGSYPENEDIRTKLSNNLFHGKYHTFGISDDSPFSVYAFKHNGKKYIMEVQSNSAEANIFILELRDFEQNISTYTANSIQKDLDQAGKAILYINFDTDQSVLKSDGVIIVDEIAKLMQTTPKLKLSIDGYTDNTGNAAHNKTLSLSRAQSVVKALTAKGINPERLKTQGFGADKPLLPNINEENKAKNRRVELVKLQ